MTTSPLVEFGIAETASNMAADVELIGVPVDLPDRAVAFVTAPIRLAIKIESDLALAKRELDALRLLDSAADVPSPQPWFSTEVTMRSGHPLSVAGTSFCDGERLGVNSPDETWQAAGSQLRVLHGLSTDGWEQHPSHSNRANDWISVLASEAESLGLLDDLTAKAFRRETLSDRLASRAPVVLHGDPGVDHVLHTGPAISGLVNFSESGIGDLAYDLAVLTLWHPDKLDLVLNGYGAEADATLSQDIRRFGLVRLLKSALWLKRYDFQTSAVVGELYERLLANS